MKSTTLFAAWLAVITAAAGIVSASEVVRIAYPKRRTTRSLQ
jgi:hypothetical protein